MRRSARRALLVLGREVLGGEQLLAHVGVQNAGVRKQRDADVFGCLEHGLVLADATAEHVRGDQ